MPTLLVADILDVLGMETKLAVGLKAAFIPACTGTAFDSLVGSERPSA